MKYKKKPVVIEAWRNAPDNEEESPMWLREAVVSGHVSVDSEAFSLQIKTLEGVMTADRGDFVIQGVKGEIYPCKPDIFEATYELVE